MVTRRTGWYLAACLAWGCGDSSTHPHAASPTSAGAGAESSDLAGAGGASGDVAGVEGGASDSAGAAGSSVGPAGSGGDDASVEYFGSGSRLKAQVLRFDDGVEVISAPDSGGWYDQDLGVDCYFAPDPSGIERCFPSRIVTGLMYADAACSQPVLAAGVLGKCRGLRSDYVRREREICGYQGLRVGDELPASTPLFSDTAGKCSPNRVTSGLGPLYELEELPADSFVAMQRRAVARASGLDAYVREGEDGSWQVIGHFDRARQAACFAPPASLGRHKECLPAYESSSDYTDSTCEVRASSALYGACKVEEPRGLMSASLGVTACPVVYDLSLFEIDSIAQVTPHQLDRAGACVQAPGQAGQYYVQGSPIDLTTLPMLDTQVVGSGSTRARFSAFGGVPYLPLQDVGPSLVDDQGVACEIYDFPDGAARCVPSSFAPTSPLAFVYEDAECSGARFLPWSPASCPKDPPLPKGVIFPDLTTECLERPTASEIVEVTGRSNASAFYAKDTTSGACQARAASPGAVYLRLGDVVDPGTFPRIERTTRD